MAGSDSSLRSVLEAAGDGDKEIWVTELGGVVEEVGEAHHAKLVETALRLWPTLPWAGVLMVYTYRDSSSDHRYDLVRPDGTKRPAWDAFREGASR